MKTLLICPNQASGIPALADSKPAAILPFLGEHFICYWMRHLASKGYSEVRIITTDPVEMIEEYTGDGSRWGIKVDIRYETRELLPAEARTRHQSPDEEGWPSPPADLIEVDHLPGIPAHKLFTSYRSFFEGMALWLPHLTESKRIGLREVASGVWVGHKTRLGRNVVFKGPCWIGDQVRIGDNAVIGPMTFLENRVVLDANCEVANSWIAPDTFVGALTHVKDSLASGNLLINWRLNSFTRIPDPFLMSSLSEEKRRQTRQGKERRSVAERLPRPFAPVISLVQKVQG